MAEQPQNISKRSEANKRENQNGNLGNIGPTTKSWLDKIPEKSAQQPQNISEMSEANKRENQNKIETPKKQEVLSSIGEEEKEERQNAIQKEGMGANIPEMSEADKRENENNTKMPANHEILSAISEEEKKESQKVFQKGGMGALGDYYKRKVEKWKEIPLNVGLIGNSGSGKSSFINAIRNLTADDDGAAKVGPTETTTQLTPYAHPNNKQLKFWDLPGVGTINFPKEGYLERVFFSKFEFFLLITEGRFTAHDKWLANEISKGKKKFFFVRTKIHSALEDDKRCHPRTHDREAVLSQIRENIRENLGDLYDERKVFLIDNYERGMYDFHTLEQRIIEEFPSLGREALILSLSTLSVEMVKKKAETLRDRIWMTSLVSGVVALYPIPGTSLAVDLALIVGQSTYYFYQLGLDKESLKRTARILSCDVSILEGVAKSVMSLLTREGIMAFISAIPGASFSLLAEEFVYYVPFFGMVAALGLSYVTTRYILKEILKKMKDTAVLVMNVAVDSAVVLSLGKQNVEMVRKKAEMLRKDIWMTSLASGAIALVPIPGTTILADIPLILAQSKYYFSQLGLDEISLGGMARSLSCDVAILQRVVNEYLERLLTKEGIMDFINASWNSIPMVALALVAEEGARYIPFIGMMVASGLSFGTTYYILDEILKKMEDTAVLVVNKAIDNRKLTISLE